MKKKERQTKTYTRLRLPCEATKTYDRAVALNAEIERIELP